MKSSLKNKLYWIGVALGNIGAYTLLAFLLGLVLGLPNTMAGGLVSWAIVLACMVFAADDEQLEAFKKLIRK